LIEKKDGKPDWQVFGESVKPVVALSPLVANSSLLSVRRIVKDNPLLYQDALDASLLQFIRPLIQSGTQIASCIDLTRLENYVMLCSLDNDVKAKNTAVLFISTMRSSCNKVSMCEYALWPMQRIK
jgi:hypothetical protein